MYMAKALSTLSQTVISNYAQAFRNLLPFFASAIEYTASWEVFEFLKPLKKSYKQLPS